MTRQVAWMVAACVVVVAHSGGALKAQPTSGYGSRPAYSPYLNLMRPGTSATQNYYGLVRPEIQARQTVGNLQGAVATNQQLIGGLANPADELPATGHQASFLNYRSYFLSGGVIGQGAGGVTNFRTTVMPQVPATPRR